MRIGCVVACFPSLSETFVLREILELEALGTEVVLFSLERPRAGKMHAESAALMAGTHYRSGPFRARPWRAVLHHLGRRPLRLAAMLARSAAPWLPRPGAFATGLRAALTAAEFARVAGPLGVRHVHAHFAHVTADVARGMAILLGGTFSVSTHARDVFAQSARDVRRRLSGASLVAACSEQTRRRVAELAPDLPADRLRLVRHGVPLARFRPAIPAGRTILAVGRLEEKKGFCYLVDACRILRDRGVDLICSIVGDGPQRDALAARIADAGLGDTVFLHGALTQDELLPLYPRAAVFALPSVVAADGDRDGVANVVLEAMASGLPVVTTAAAAADEAVVDGVSGCIVPARDAAALADRLQALLGDDAGRAAMGRAGRERVQRDYDARRNAALLRALFAAL